MYLHTWITPNDWIIITYIFFFFFMEHGVYIGIYRYTTNASVHTHNTNYRVKKKNHWPSSCAKYTLI